MSASTRPSLRAAKKTRNKDQESENDSNFASINYESVFEDNQVFSNFCKINTDGFKGSKENKEGFLLGPSVYRIANKDDPDDAKTYEIYAPRIFIKDNPFDSKSSFK